MCTCLSIPVTAKCRTGIDKIEDYDFLQSFVESIANQNISTIIIHARNAILKGLSPRQNRTIPPLKYDYVYRIKEDFPELEIIINGGIDSLTEAKDHLQNVDGVMLGRAPYDNPMMLDDVDSEIFGEPKKQILRLDILKEYLTYLEELNDPKIRLNQVLKHIYGLNKGLKNARKYNIKTYYLQNGCITPGFPILTTNYALVEGQYSKDIYKRKISIYYYANHHPNLLRGNLRQGKGQDGEGEPGDAADRVLGHRRLPAGAGGQGLLGAGQGRLAAPDAGRRDRSPGGR